MATEELGGGMTATELAVFLAKNERNARVQARYDALMQVGRHGHYETMFKVVREEVEAERERCAKLAELWLTTFGERGPTSAAVSAQTWANDAVKDIAEAIREGAPLSSTHATTNGD